MQWDPPEKLEEILDFHSTAEDQWEKGEMFCFSIDSKKRKEFIGRVGIHKEEIEKEWNLGFWTHPKHQSQGYMSEIVPFVLEFIFTRLSGEAVIACHALWNKSSEKVLKKSGFEFVRSLPEGFKKNGTWVEENLLKISKEKWNANKTLERNAEIAPLSQHPSARR